MTRGEHEADVRSFLESPYKREDAIGWFKMGFDMNGDGGVDIHECEAARSHYLGVLELAFAETCETVMLHCDCDGDGVITEEDFQRSVFTCLRNAQAVKMIDYFLLSRIKNGKAFA